MLHHVRNAARSGQRLDAQPDYVPERKRGFFAKKRIDLGQSSVDEGPMFATRINLSNSVPVKPLPAITNLPLGAPVVPNVHAAPAPPSYTG